MVYRIGDGKKYLMLLISIIIDIIEIFSSPTIILAVLSGVIQYGIMWGMFATSGVKFFGSRKKMTRNLGGAILESIPFVDMLPIFTWNVWKTIEESRKEDDAKENEGKPQVKTSGVIRGSRLSNMAGASQESRDPNSNTLRQKRTVNN